MVHVLSTENFEQEVLKEKGAVLIDLYADWCGPCKVLSPTVEAIANEVTDVKVGKINIDQNPDIASQ